MLKCPSCRHLVLMLLVWGGFAGIASAGALERLFAPKAELWARWADHDPDATRSIDHQAWDGFLKRHVESSPDGINRVAYSQVTSQDRAGLDAYIQGLARLPISRFSRAEQLAYWINLYNALTVRVVLDHYPVASIRDIDISPGLFADGPWGKALVEIEGERLTLNDIEHRVLRPVWQDPRIHYAVNCASLGCPNLSAEAFTAANSERLLDDAARAYINHPRGVRAGPDGLTLSSIYNWFASDFDVDGGVPAHLQRYAAPGLKARLDGRVETGDYAYDWSLNDVLVEE